VLGRGPLIRVFLNALVRGSTHPGTDFNLEIYTLSLNHLCVDQHIQVLPHSLNSVERAHRVPAARVGELARVHRLVERAEELDLLARAEDLDERLLHLRFVTVV
jgi:hypothetical protein